MHHAKLFKMLKQAQIKNRQSSCAGFIMFCKQIQFNRAYESQARSEVLVQTRWF